MSTEGIRINVSIEDRQVAAMLRQIFQRMGDTRPALRTIGEIVRTSIARNFAAGGRPTAWKPSARALAQSGQTLSNFGILRRSFTTHADACSVSVGTNVVYAAVHNFGFRGTVQVKAHGRRTKSGKTAQVKAHSRQMNIVRREFMLVQDEDWKEMTQALGRFIVGGR